MQPGEKSTRPTTERLKRVRPRKKPPASQENASKKNGGKYPAIQNGGQSICNEQVGIHFRVEKGGQAPEEGDCILVETGKAKVTLLVQHVRSCVNGETLVQAFTFLKGEYKHLAEVKGRRVRINWSDE